MNTPDPDPLLARMASHSTVRRFTEAPVPDADVERVLRAAQMAATSSNVQAYALLEVSDPALRAELVTRTGGQSQVAEAARFFVICAEQRRHRLAAERAGNKYVPNLETFLVGVIDATLFVQNAVLGFEALGYGTCYIGGLRNELAGVDELLELPADVFPLFGLCVGISAEVPDVKPRLPLDAVWMRERFPTDDELAQQLDEYDQTMASYYAARGLEGRNWTGGLARKFETPKREHLAGYFRSKGAVLDERVEG